VLPEEDAAGAVDGQIRGRFSFHTGQDENPYWQVDLGEVYELSRVAVYNPHVPERTARMRLLLSDEGTTWRCAYQHDDTPPLGEGGRPPFVIPLDQQRARFVRIQVPGRIWLHLDQVQVMAADGQTNLALGKPATQSSTSQWSTRSIRIDAARAEPDDMALAKRAIEPVLQSLGALQQPLRIGTGCLAGRIGSRWTILALGRPVRPGVIHASTDPRRPGRLAAFQPARDADGDRGYGDGAPGAVGDLESHRARLDAVEARLPALIDALAPARRELGRSGGGAGVSARGLAGQSAAGLRPAARPAPEPGRRSPFGDERSDREGGQLPRQRYRESPPVGITRSPPQRSARAAAAEHAVPPGG
jgi:hypothetical protein